MPQEIYIEISYKCVVVIIVTTTKVEKKSQDQILNLSFGKYPVNQHI